MMGYAQSGRSLGTSQSTDTKTVVIFRKFRDGYHEVIALFPEIPGDRSGNECESYMHVGQHGSADPWLVMRNTTAARPDDYASLKRELESLGYKLVVKKKLSQLMHNRRRGWARGLYS